MKTLKPSEDKKRIREAVQEAEFNFWSGMAARFPEASSGDFDIDMTINMQVEMEKWIKHWLELNADPNEE